MITVCELNTEHLCLVFRFHFSYGQVALFGLPVGEKYFAKHNDGSNARVALLIPLTQGENSALVVRGDPWEAISCRC